METFLRYFISAIETRDQHFTWCVYIFGQYIDSDAGGKGKVAGGKGSRRRKRKTTWLQKRRSLGTGVSGDIFAEIIAESEGIVFPCAV